MKNGSIIYGWITVQEPITIIVLGHDEEMIRSCEGQAESQAGKRVVLFRYNGIAISYPNNQTFGHTRDHGDQILQFINQTDRPIPNCIFNDGAARFIRC